MNDIGEVAPRFTPLRTVASQSTVRNQRIIVRPDEQEFQSGRESDTATVALQKPAPQLDRLIWPFFT